MARHPLPLPAVLPVKLLRYDLHRDAAAQHVVWVVARASVEAAGLALSVEFAVESSNPSVAPDAMVDLSNGDASVSVLVPGRVLVFIVWQHIAWVGSSLRVH